MIASFCEQLGTTLKGRWLGVLVTAVLVYFGYHALHGQRGVLAWIDKSRALEAAREELMQVQVEHAELDRQVKAFQRDSIDRDLLEEELRRLGYVMPNEVIILHPSQPVSPLPAAPPADSSG